MTDETVTVTISEAHALGRAALEAIGLTVEEAHIVVDHLIDNSLCGYRFAGLPRILAIADSADIRRPRFPLTVEHETAVSARIDGGNHVRGRQHVEAFRNFYAGAHFNWKLA